MGERERGCWGVRVCVRERNIEIDRQSENPHMPSLGRAKPVHEQIFYVWQAFC